MTKIIAEVASCHNGDLEMAKALIRAAAECGADIVKFQDWRANKIPKTDKDKKRYEELEFKDEWYPILIKECEKNGVEFLTTVFHKDRVGFLRKKGIKRVKISSVHFSNDELIFECGKNFDEVIISSGMHDSKDFEKFHSFVRSFFNIEPDTIYTLMHCVAEYPTKNQNANLHRIQTIKESLLMEDPIGVVSVGYSDHTMGIEAPIIAISKGIKYLEKHFTLSRKLPQKKHTMARGKKSLTTHEIACEPHELKQICEWRDLIGRMNGSGKPKVSKEQRAIKQRYIKRYG